MSRVVVGCIRLGRAAGPFIGRPAASYRFVSPHLKVVVPRSERCFATVSESTIYTTHGFAGLGETAAARDDREKMQDVFQDLKRTDTDEKTELDILERIFLGYATGQSFPGEKAKLAMVQSLRHPAGISY